MQQETQLFFYGLISINHLRDRTGLVLVGLVSVYIDWVGYYVYL